jgi:hypothetical protein
MTPQGDKFSPLTRGLPSLVPPQWGFSVTRLAGITTTTTTIVVITIGTMITIAGDLVAITAADFSPEFRGRLVQGCCKKA